MSRRRYISTEISTDIKLAELAEYGPLPLLLYTWAIPHMDDWGRMSGESRQFKLLVCPALDITVRDVETALQQIASSELWYRYQVDGKWYIAIPETNWFKYQTYINKDKRRKDESKFPPPNIDDGTQTIPPNTEDSQETPQNTASPSPSPTPSPSPSPSIDNNNNNNVREENEQNVNESEETESQKVQDANETPKNVNDSSKTESMAIGTRAVVWAEKNWGRLIPKGEADMIIAFCDDFFSRGSPDPDAVVIEALRCCITADVRKINYLNKVLIDWKEAGIITVDQAKVRSSEHKCKNQKGHKRKNKDPGDKPPDPSKPGKYDNFYL